MKKENLEQIARICDVIYYYRCYFRDRFQYTDETWEHIEEAFGTNRRKGWSLSGYKSALSDTATMVNDLNPHMKERFLNDFRAHFGEDFFRIAADPKKIAVRAVRRGRIKDDDEFNTLKDYLGSELSEDRSKEIARLLEKYELGS